MGGFVDPEMCLLLVLPTECSKVKSCLGSPASPCNSRTVAVPVCSPYDHFPEFTSISSWSTTSCPSVQYRIHRQFSPSLPSPPLGSPLCLILSSGKDGPFLLCCMHLQAGRNVDEGARGQLPSQHFQQEEEQVPQELLHRTADLPKAGRLKLGISTACEISPGESISVFTSGPPSTELSCKALGCIRPMQEV